MQNIPYTKYLTKQIKLTREALNQDYFNFILDNRISTPPRFFLKPNLWLLLRDTENPPKNFTIKNPIEDHAARVYQYLKCKHKGVDESDSDDSGSDDDDDKMMKNHHGIAHLCSAAFLAPVMVSFYARHGDGKEQKN